MTGQIILTSVTKQFGNTVAVDDVSLQVESGEFFSLLGPSGCGKTTTLRIIGGFVYPTAGEVYINGELMAETPPYRRPVNTVFQNYALVPAQNSRTEYRVRAADEKEHRRQKSQML